MAKNNIEVRILGDARGLNDTLGESEGRLGRFGSAMGKTLGIAAAGIAVGALAIGAGLKASVDQASNLNESLNAVNVTFGESAAGILKLGEEAATAVGLSNAEFNGLAVQFSSFAKTISGPGGDVAGTMDEMTTRAADFASVMNVEVADAAAMFQSGLAGETEPLKKYGLDLSAAAVENYALANGIIKAGEEMTEAQKVQARYGALMEQTSSAQGDFANTSDGLANQQRILSARFKDIAAKVGTALLPILAKLAEFVGERLVPWFEKYLPLAIDVLINVIGELRERLQVVVDWVKTNWPAIQRVLVTAATAVKDALVDAFDAIRTAIQWLGENEHVLAAIAVVIGGALAVAIGTWMAATYAQVAALWAQATAFAAAHAPIAAIVIAIAALTAGVIWAYENWGWFRDAVDTVARFLQDVVWPIIQTVAENVIAAFKEIVTWTRNHWDQIKAIVEGVVNAIRAVVERVIGAVQVFWETFGDGILEHARLTWDAIKLFIDTTINAIKAVVNTVLALFRGDWDAAWNGVKEFVNTIWEGIKGLISLAIDSIKNGFTTAKDGVVAAAQEVWDTIKTKAGEAFDAVVQFVIDLPGRILEWIGDVKDAAVDLGEAIIEGVGEGVRGLVEGGLGIAEALANGVIGFFNSNVIDKINGLLEFTVSIPTSPWTQKDFRIDPPDIPRIPTFHTGGWVPGRPGMEVPALLEAGEYVVSRREVADGSMGGGIHIGQLVTGTTTNETIEAMRRLEWLRGEAA